MVVKDLISGGFFDELKAAGVSSNFLGNPSFKYIFKDFFYRTWYLRGFWYDSIPYAGDTPKKQEVKKEFTKNGIKYSWEDYSEQFELTIAYEDTDFCISSDNPERLIITASCRKQIQKEAENKGPITKITNFCRKELFIEDGEIHDNTYLMRLGVDDEGDFELRQTHDEYSDIGIMYKHVFQKYLSIPFNRNVSDDIDVIKEIKGAGKEYEPNAEVILERIGVHCIKLSYTQVHNSIHGGYRVDRFNGCVRVPFNMYDEVPAFDIRPEYDEITTYENLAISESNLSTPLTDEEYKKYVAKIRKLNNEQQVNELTGLLNRTRKFTYDPEEDPYYENTGGRNQFGRA